jgi:glutathione S-transferase
MSLVLHYHPLSSYCHKVLIALYEMNLPFEGRLLNLGDPSERDAYLKLCPTGKMPLLEDGGQVVAESSIIIEHLALRHAPSQGLLPAEPLACLDVRLWDRLFDQYVMTPMQAVVAQRLRAEGERDPLGTSTGLATLGMAYGLLEKHLAGRTWSAGDGFSMADCAAAPALFYASTLLSIPADKPHLAAYVARLMTRPSVVRVLDEARPFFKYYPYKEGLPAQYRGE